MNKIRNFFVETYYFLTIYIWKFFKNIWKFRKELYDFRDYDFVFPLQMLYRSFYLQKIGLEKYSNEISETKDLKIKKISRVLTILGNIIEDRYLDMAEKELGYKYLFGKFSFEKDGEHFNIKNSITKEQEEKNSTLIRRGVEMELEEYDELFKILKGQGHAEYEHFLNLKRKENKSSCDVFEEWFDGSGLKNWWY